MSNLHGVFDTAIIIWIAIMDTLAVYLVWRSVQLKEKARVKRKFNALLRRLGVTV